MTTWGPEFKIFFARESSEIFCKRWLFLFKNERFSKKSFLHFTLGPFKVGSGLQISLTLLKSK